MLIRLAWPGGGGGDGSRVRLIGGGSLLVVCRGYLVNTEQNRDQQASLSLVDSELRAMYIYLEATYHTFFFLNDNYAI